VVTMSNPKDRSEDPARRLQPRELLKPNEVAARFSVTPKTVARWHQTGKIDAFKTLGGHRRFDAEQVQNILDQGNG